METNYQKAKRTLIDNSAILGIELPEDGLILRMLKLAATPDKDLLDAARDCSTCKHKQVSKYVEPCYGCMDNDDYGNFERLL